MDFPTFEQFRDELRAKAINEKSEDQSYEYGCVMGYFSESDTIPVELDEEDIYNNEENEFGREIDPHVTLLYGLKDDQIDEDEMIEFLSHLALPVVELTQSSLFENDDFDVLKWDVESPALNVLNKAIAATFPNENKYPEYHAHETIAYMKSGTGKKYTRTLETPVKKQIDIWVYSRADGKKIAIHAPKADDVYIEELRAATVDEKEEEQDKLQADSTIEQVVYEGFTINSRTQDKKKFYFTVLQEGVYKMGIKGPTSYEQGLEACKSYINNNLVK